MATAKRKSILNLKFEAHERSSVCLLCCEECSSSDSSDGTITRKKARLADIGVNIVGGQNCSELVNNLEKMFILLKVLDMPKEWCEQVLQEPEDWFDVCRECLEIYVSRAWDIHQKIGALQGKMASIKEEIREGMREGVKKMSYGRVETERDRDGWDYKIKRLLFPDLFPDSSEDIEGEAKVGEAVVDMNDDSEMEGDTFGDGDTDLDFQVYEDNVDLDLDDKITFKNQQTPEKHKKWSRLMCRTCGYRYRHLKDYDAHHSIHQEVGPSGEFVCPHCQYPARSREELRRHKKSRHSKQRHDKPAQNLKRKTFDCPKCPLQTQVWTHLKKHVDLKHPDLTESDLQSFGLSLKCELCQKEFETLSTLTSHKMKMHPSSENPVIWPCPECGVKFVSSKLLHNHVRNTHERQTRFVCEECGTGFPSKSHLDHHMLSHLDKSQRSKSRIICHLCGIDFRGKWDLSVHNAKYHSSNSSKNPPEKMYKCCYCDFKSTIGSLINRHLKTHKDLDQLGHRCQQCSKTYTTARALQRHVRILHEDNGKSWPCPYCAKPFSCENYMKGHIRKYCQVKRLEIGGTTASIPTKSESETGESYQN